MDTILFSIFLFCVIGCGLSSYHLGRLVGIRQSIDFLVDEGVLDAED